MTICIATNVSTETTGGVAIFNNHFISLFTKYQHKIILLIVDHKSDLSLEDKIEETNSLLIKVILRKSYHEKLNYFKPYFRPGGCEAPRLIATGLAMRNWLLKNHADYNINVIEASDHGGIGIFLIDNRLPPLFITTHASNLQITRYNNACNDEHGKVIKQLEKLSYKNCDGIISHSPIITEELKELSTKPILTLPIPWEKKYISTSDDKQYGLVIGQLQTLKGPVVLFKAINKAVQKNKQLLIHWIGNDTATLKGSPSVIQYLKSQFPYIFQKHFVWIKTMPHERVLQEIANAAYIIIPSLWETFSYIALEAASMAKPIIITKGTGASYLFTNNIDALIINSNDEEELCKAILKLEFDKTLRTYLGNNAKKLVSEKFIPDNIVHNRIQAYEIVINEKNRNVTPLENHLSFLKNYLTFTRKFYFSLRAKAKKLLKKIR